MKNFKKFQILLICISICAVIFLLVQVYAKYLTTTQGNTNLTIAQWNIKVNNLSIKNNTDISSVIQPVFPGNDNIASGIIAPTAEGYFDLNLDFTNADVSFTYTIETNVNENSTVKDLVSTGYAFDEDYDNKTIFENYNQTITETIKLSDNITSRKIRIYILWNDDDDTQTMNNIEDTASTIAEGAPLLDVKLTFTQLKETSTNQTEENTNETDNSIEDNL